MKAPATVLLGVDAERDLDQIAEYGIAQGYANSDQYVAGLVRRIALLESQPLAGHLGRVDGTRELVVVPYIAVYVTNSATNTITILRVLHGVQAWP